MTVKDKIRNSLKEFGLTRLDGFKFDTVVNLIEAEFPEFRMFVMKSKSGNVYAENLSCGTYYTTFVKDENGFMKCVQFLGNKSMFYFYTEG